MGTFFREYPVPSTDGQTVDRREPIGLGPVSLSLPAGSSDQFVAGGSTLPDRHLSW
jgi:hypothetical protein